MSLFFSLDFLCFNPSLQCFFGNLNLGLEGSGTNGPQGTDWQRAGPGGRTQVWMQTAMKLRMR